MSEHELWNELGNLYYLSGSFNQAIYAYGRSIQMENRFGRPYSNLALAYVQQGRYAEAVKLYQTGIDLLEDDKEKAISWYRLGDVYRCLKNYRDAILAYQQGDLLDPTLSQDGRELGNVLYESPGYTTVPELSHVVVPDENTQPMEVVSPPPDQIIEPEPAIVEEITKTSEESMVDTDAKFSILHQEAEEVATVTDHQSDSPFDEEYFPTLFEQEPVEEQQTRDWFFYHDPNDPESITIDADSGAYSSQELGEIPPIPNSAQSMHASEKYSSYAHESQLDLLVEPQEAHAPIPIVAAEQDECISATKESEAATDPEQETTTESSVVVPVETELEIKKIGQALETDPNNAAAWQMLGDLQKSAKRYDDALYAYQQAVSNDPKNVDYIYRLGMGYAIEGRIEEALRTFQEVLKLSPNHGLAHATLGGYYRKLGFEDLAKKHITIAMKNIYNSENEYNRACLHALCGNYDEAFTLLKVALETRQTFVDWVLRDPDLDSIRSDPRFKQLLSEFI